MNQRINPMAMMSMRSSGDADQARNQPCLDANTAGSVAHAVGAQLRALFQQPEAAPLPEDMLAVLGKLDLS